MNLQEISSFVALARWSSFTRAAEQLGTPKQTLSRRIATLESRLGVRLVSRTTRSVELTDAGRRLLEKVSTPLEEIESAIEESRQEAAAPTGELRIACPQLFGRRFLPKVIDLYLERFADASVSVRLVDALTPPTWEGLDLLIHVGNWPGSPVRRTSLGPAINRCYASPGYLARAGTPHDPGDLNEHPCISYAREATRVTWRLKRKRQKRRVSLTPRLKVNDAELALELAIAGRGIAQLPAFLCEPHVESGELERVLEEWSVEIGDIFALTRPGARRPAKVTAFLKLLRESTESLLRAPTP